MNELKKENKILVMTHYIDLTVESLKTSELNPGISRLLQASPVPLQYIVIISQPCTLDHICLLLKSLLKITISPGMFQQCSFPYNFCRD